MASRCEDCGCKVYDGRCTNCHEELFILDQYYEQGMSLPSKDSLFMQEATKQEKKIKRKKSKIMKKLFLFAMLLLTVGLTSCSKDKPKVKYRVDFTAYEVTTASITCKEYSTGEWVYGTSGQQNLSFEWMGAKQNKITIKLNHPVDLGAGTIALYADDKLIGEAIGEQPTLVVDRNKK